MFRLWRTCHLDDRSLNIDTFDWLYVLMGHALPEEAQYPPVLRAGSAQPGVHPQVSDPGETARARRPPVSVSMQTPLKRMCPRIWFSSTATSDNTTAPSFRKSS